MKSLVITAMLCVSSQAMAWTFGGLDVQEMKEIQENSYQTGRACLRGDRLDSCSDYIKNISKHSELLAKHQDEIVKKVREGDSTYQRIMNNAERLQALSVEVLSRNKR